MSDEKSAADLSMEEILQSIQRIIAEDERPGPLRPVVARATADNDDNILELTEALNPDGTVRPLIPVGQVAKPILASAEESPKPVLTPETATSQTSEPSTPAEPAATIIEPIAAPSPPAAAEPVAEANRPTHPTASLGGRTLDDLAADLLRPMLAAWLDEHLPAIVERMVRERGAPTLDPAGRPADPG